MFIELNERFANDPEYKFYALRRDDMRKTRERKLTLVAHNECLSREIAQKRAEKAYQEEVDEKCELVRDERYNILIGTCDPELITKEANWKIDVSRIPRIEEVERDMNKNLDLELKQLRGEICKAALGRSFLIEDMPQQEESNA